MYPSVSIIIPVYNDPFGLKETLDCLVTQVFPKDQYEIIVIDNGSTDSTFEIGNSYADQFHGLIRFVLENKVKGSYAARNKGIEVSHGKLLIFMDANVTVGSDYIEKVNDRFRKSDVDYLGCNVKMIIKKPSISSTYNSIHGFKIENSIHNENYTPTCNLIVKRKVINKIGNFDSRLEGGGDFEFGERVTSAGFRLDYAKGIILYHPTRSSYKSLIEKAIRIGRGNAQMAFYYPKKYKYLMNRHFHLQAFSPRNPLTYFSIMKDEKIAKRIFFSVLFSVYHIPTQLSSTIACLRKTRQLSYHQI
jgi:glycosyltransferase involved in cell wall biosynthesis